MTQRPEIPERDSRTVRLLIEGDSDGLRRLIDDHGGHVRAHLRRRFQRILDDWQLDEAMSLAAVRAWQSAQRFDPTLGRLRAWFAVIARNCALSVLAQKQGDPFVPIDGVDSSVLGTNSPSEAERMRLMFDVHRAIEKLPHLQRLVLLADMNAGATLPAIELAGRFGATTQSIYVARARGRRELRHQLRRLGYEDQLAFGSGRGAHEAATLPQERRAT